MTEPEESYVQSHDTGESSSSKGGMEGTRITTQTIGPYTIMVRVTKDNKFLDIVEIQVNKDFLSVEQRIESSGSYDVSDLYE